MWFIWRHIHNIQHKCWEVLNVYRHVGAGERVCPPNYYCPPPDFQTYGPSLHIKRCTNQSLVARVNFSNCQNLMYHKPCPSKKQPRWSEQSSIYSTKSWASDKNRNNPSHRTVDSISKSHSHGLRPQNFSLVKDGMKGHNGEDIDNQTERTGNCNGSW